MLKKHIIIVKRVLVFTKKDYHQHMTLELIDLKEKYIHI